MQCFTFDISIGGKVTCQTCVNCPDFADRGTKVSREDCYFGQPKTGHKWEFFKAHLETKEHKQCLKESDPQKSHPKVNNLMAGMNTHTETGKIAQQHCALHGEANSPKRPSRRSCASVKSEWL